MGSGGIGGLFSDGSATSVPFTAQASGGPVTIPQGSDISNMAPGLTGFEPQSQGMNWGAALKGLTQGIPNPQGQAQVPGMTVPPGIMQQQRGVGGGQGATNPLTGMPMISMPLIHSALQALKGRMGSF